ncbi:ECs_2282 family putative zinc-binding protein [Psychrobacter celer]|uniref:ECs_2282 family putative zinc-binding protein n=1 Tax=Psychrobacter celer TaxID=306572 RepID=UPI003FCFB2BD
MNNEKYDRNISSQCPTCGCTSFSHDEGVDETIQIVTCASCEREFNKDELMLENSENIDEHLSEIKSEMINDVANEIHQSLKKAFSGNKNIRFK